MHTERDVATQLEALRRQVAQLAEGQQKRDEIEATLLSLSPKRQTTIIERPKLKTSVLEGDVGLSI